MASTRGCLLGMGRTARPTTFEDFGGRFPPSLAGTQLQRWEFVSRNPPVSARLHEGEGRGTGSPCPNPFRLAPPGSHSHTVSRLSPAPHPRASGNSQQARALSPYSNQGAAAQRKGSKTQTPFHQPPRHLALGDRSLAEEQLSMTAYPGRSDGTENTHGAVGGAGGGGV